MTTHQELRDRFEQAQNESESARAALEAARSERRARSERLRQLRSELADQRTRAETRALVPREANEGGTAVATRTEELEAEIEELETAEENAREEYEEAKEQLASLATSLARREAEAVRKANRSKVRALEDLAAAALDAYKQLAEAEDAVGAAEGQLRRVLPAANASPKERHGLERYTEEPLDDLSPEARIGLEINRALRECRRANAPFDDIWAELGISLLPADPTRTWK